MIPKKVILLVEDNSDDEELTLLAFENSAIDARVVVVRDGVTALDYLCRRGAYADRRSGDLPELILLDLKLPKLGGLDVLREIRAMPETKLLPVVVLTTSQEDRDLVRSYDLGCNSYIRKPVDYCQFQAVLHSLSQYWLHLNAGPPLTCA